MMRKPVLLARLPISLNDSRYRFRITFRAPSALSNVFNFHPFLWTALIKHTRPFLNKVSKAKAAKLVRALMDLFLDMEVKTGKEVETCRVSAYLQPMMMNSIHMFIKSVVMQWLIFFMHYLISKGMHRLGEVRKTNLPSTSAGSPSHRSVHRQ